MSRERLDEILRMDWGNLRPSQIIALQWLIEQVKHVQSLEQIKSDAINQIDVTQRKNERLEKRVQELEEILRMVKQHVKKEREINVNLTQKVDHYKNKYEENIKSARKEFGNNWY